MTQRLSLCAIASALMASACVHFFEGTVAELEQGSELTVILAASSYGDCFRPVQRVPIVYAVTRPNYSLRVAHGMRYWPEFFLIAHDSNGVVLDISGAGIQPVEFPRGGDMRRLREARGTDLSHHAVLDVPRGYDQRIRQDLTVKAVREGRIGTKTIVFEIHDSEVHILGQEQLRYRVSSIRCRESDGP